MSSRRRRTREEIRDLVREFEESGLGEAEFSKGAGIQPQHLRRWLKREGPRGIGSSVVRVKVRGSSPVAPQDHGDDRVEVALGNGRVVRVAPDFDPQSLLRLIETLEG